ncbi:MAG: DUF6249 domain-containing protein [Bacteroidales bacterium]
MIDALQEPVMGLLGLGLCFFSILVVYRAIKLKNQEKLALIEKGLDPTLADPKPRSQQNSLKNGLILIGIALGVLCGYILTRLTALPNFVAYSTMVLIFCGAILVYVHKSKME